MDGDRTQQALARIDAAMARIEQASHRSASLKGSAEALAQLQARHERLRGAVGDGLQQLDQLIGSAQG